MAGVPPPGSGCQPSASAAGEASSQSGIPNAMTLNARSIARHLRDHREEHTLACIIEHLCEAVELGRIEEARLREGLRYWRQKYIDYTFASAIEAAIADKTAQTGLAEGESAVGAAETPK
jgi:hypothetical protein